jgi:hypothetical protein
MADSDGQAWLKAHRQRAERLVYVFAGLALLALAGIVGSLKWPRLAFALAAATLLLSLAALGVGGWIAYAGGKIRHREFRNEPPPKSRGSLSLNRHLPKQPQKSFEENHDLPQRGRPP